MMAAVAPAVWALFPHILATLNATGAANTYAKVNAFIAPLDASASESVLLLPVMLGEAPGGTVALNLTRISRVWPTAGPQESSHPLVRARARARARADSDIPPAAPASYLFEALWPGQGATWMAIAGPFSTDSMAVQVVLQSGAALVRVRRVAGLTSDD